MPVYTPVALLLPGDSIPPSQLPIPPNPSQSLRLGPGLQQSGPSSITPSLSGPLLTDPKKHAAWIESASGRYIPSVNDPVLAIVHHSSAEAFMVNITPYTSYASLPHLAFEGVSKKTRPNLVPGSLVYARVCTATKHQDTEITCVNPASGKADGMGELKGGMVFDVSLGFARRLLMGKQREDGQLGVLEDAAEKIKFEIAVGRNGKVWVDASSVKEVLMVGKALTETDQRGSDLDAQKKLVRKLLRDV